ncbi:MULTISPECIES: hypothetical protein [Paraburkholderia]|uniref:immunity protein Imm33 domain-containing protein n=1 Tax=Paraburkholderia TaxID=1822464 RepID=UPI00225BD7AA|nr:MULTISPECIES: hypothetical protein [Paraburkholderia]
MHEQQRAVCQRFRTQFSACDMHLKLGVSLNVKSGVRPLNGMRINADRGTNGWFIWAGETFSQDPDFFVPLHGEHLKEWAPLALPYLALPPGWRFLIAEGYEDVWEDLTLLGQ